MKRRVNLVDIQTDPMLSVGIQTQWRQGGTSRKDWS